MITIIDDNVNLNLAVNNVITTVNVTSVVKYIIFTATSVSSLSEVYFDNGGYTDWPVQVALVHCTYDQSGKTYAIRVTCPFYSDTSVHQPKRVVMVYGTIYANNPLMYTQFNFEVDIYGCGGPQDANLYTIRYKTIIQCPAGESCQDSGDSNFDIEPYVNHNILVHDTHPGNPHYSEDLEKAALKIVVGRKYQENFNNHTNMWTVKCENSMVLNPYTFDGEWRFLSGSTSACSVGFHTLNTNGTVKSEQMPYSKEYLSNGEGRLIFNEPCECIGYHTFSFGEHYDYDECNDAADSDERTYRDWAAEEQYNNSCDSRYDTKLNNNQEETYNSDYNFYSGDYLEAVYLPDSIKIIGNCAFKNNKNLSLVDIQNTSSLERIGAYAFEGCSLSRGINLVEGIKNIGEGAFKHSGIGSITLPSSLKIVEPAMFDGCSGLTAVTFAKSTNTTSIIKIGAFAFRDTGLKSVTIPAGVQYIGRSAFKNVKFERTFKLILPSTIAVIDERAFAGISSYSVRESDFAIQEIDLSKCTSLFIIRTKAFRFRRASVYKLPYNVSIVEYAAFDTSSNNGDVELYMNGEAYTSFADENFESASIKKIYIYGTTFNCDLNGHSWSFDDPQIYMTEAMARSIATQGRSSDPTISNKVGNIFEKFFNSSGDVISSRVGEIETTPGYPKYGTANY